MAEQQWIFVVKALDRPGTLTAAAAVFSNRGVSLEAILGSGIAPTTVEDGRLVFSFRATPAKQQLLYRALKRLTSIFDIAVYTDDDERLRAIAIARLALDSTISHGQDYRLETVTQTATEHIVMLTGSPPAVTAALAQFREQQQLRDVVMSYIAV